MLQKIKQYIETYHLIEDSDRLLVGVSGGADSVCLLSVLQKLYGEKNQIFVLHIHHGVREDADLDAAYVNNLCEKMQIPFYQENVDMEAYAKNMKISSEEAGRELRYQYFEEYAKRLECNKICVAHQVEDQAETVLFRLFRGTGIKGLCGMSPMRNHIIRPLLGITRAEIENYLKEEHIFYCEDSTNKEDIYTRNKIRHHIIPYAEEYINGNSCKHICETAQRLQLLWDYMKDKIDESYRECVISESLPEKIELNAELILSMHRAMRQEILLLCLEKLTYHKKDIGAEHIEQIEKLLLSQGTKQCHLPYQIIVEKSYETVTFSKEKDHEIVRNHISIEVKKEDLCENDKKAVYVNGNTYFFRVILRDEQWIQDIIKQEKKYTKWLDYDKIQASVHIRTRSTGDYFICNRQGQKKLIKDYMINEKIPKNERDTLYMIAEGNHVIWIPGYRISEEYKVDQNTKRILEIQLQEEKNG